LEALLWSEPVDLARLIWCELGLVWVCVLRLAVEKAREGVADDSASTGGRHRQGPTTLALAREKAAILFDTRGAALRGGGRLSIGRADKGV